MMRFRRRSRRQCEQLRVEVERAKEQLKRAEEAEPRVRKLASELHSHVKDNHIGDRLKLAFEKSNRRNHGTA